MLNHDAVFVGTLAAIVAGAVGVVLVLKWLLPEEYAGLSEGRAYGVAAAAIANQRSDAETIQPAVTRRGRVLGRSAWVFEFASAEGDRFCVYVWHQRGPSRGGRSILGECT